MIDFQHLKPEQKAQYDAVLFSCPPRGCEYSFANLSLWGQQDVAFVRGCVAFFSHFHDKILYPYPIGAGDRKAVLEEVLQDARERDIPCHLSGLTAEDCQDLERWFPGRFHLRPSRDDFDYVYAIDDLADLKGRKYQKKRNHTNRFRAEHPDCTTVPLPPETLPAARNMVNNWYRLRREEDPSGDYLPESIAMHRCFQNYTALGMEGLLLLDGEEVLAVTIGSRMRADTYDIHFEKAREDVTGAYSVINQEFARYLRQKYPELIYLNREDDMGLERLRKTKESYLPHHMLEKYRARLREDNHDL